MVMALTPTTTTNSANGTMCKLEGITLTCEGTRFRSFRRRRPRIVNGVSPIRIRLQLIRCDGSPVIMCVTIRGLGAFNLKVRRAG